jgi:hypothetical protein
MTIHLIRLIVSANIDQKAVLVFCEVKYGFLALREPQTPGTLRIVGRMIK